MLLRAVQFLFVAACCVNDQGSADACRTVSNYKKEISSQTSCTVCYLLLRAVQFLFVAACRVNDQGSADACRTVSNYKKEISSQTSFAMTKVQQMPVAQLANTKKNIWVCNSTISTAE